MNIEEIKLKGVEIAQLNSPDLTIFLYSLGRVIQEKGLKAESEKLMQVSNYITLAATKLERI